MNTTEIIVDSSKITAIADAVRSQTGSEEEMSLSEISTEIYSLNTSFQSSVKDKKYGAKGDGITDDTEAFQTALAENRVVFVPGGDYVLSDTLVIRANCCLELSQDTVLRFTQTDKHGITMLRLANLKGNHATIFVPYAFGANVINCDGGEDYALLDPDNLANSNTTAVPPFKKWDPQWKMSRYVTDINICKPNANGFHYSNDGTCYGNGIYIHCDEADWPANYMWGVSMSGVRIAGGFNHGIRIYNIGEHTKSWSHDMRIEAVIEACKIGVSVENAYYNRLAVTFQPRPAADGTAYSEHGIKITDSKGIDLSSSRIWDWMTKDEETGKSINSKWEPDNEFQHIAMYGDCRGLILDDFIYYAQSTYDIRDLIYTDTPGNLEKMTILQEPITRWFKPVDGKPHFNDGYSDKKLVTEEELDEHFVTDIVPQFTDVLATAVDTDGTTIYNGIGYKMGVYMNGYNNIVAAANYGVTGFIPVQVGSKIYTNDLSFAGYDGYVQAMFYDASRTPLANGSYYLFEKAEKIVAGTSSYLAYEETENGFICTVKSHTLLTNLAYVRFSFRDIGFGAKPMIAIDEEIKYTVEGFLADGIKVKAENVIGLPSGIGVTLTSPNGTLYKIIVNDDGTLGTEQI